MGNTPLQPKQKKTNCSDYKHSNIVNAIYSVLSNYQIEAMCDCASWILRELLLEHNYTKDQVDLICCTVNDRNHVFVFDKLEHYYIDITSEQFEDTKEHPIQPCICSKTIDVFVNLGYDILGEDTDQVCKTFCKELVVLYDKGKPITRTDLLNKIKNKLNIRGGKRKNVRKTRRH